MKIIKVAVRLHIQPKKMETEQNSLARWLVITFYQIFRLAFIKKKRKNFLKVCTVATRPWLARSLQPSN